MAFSFGTDNDLGFNTALYGAAFNQTDEAMVIYANSDATSVLTGRVFDYVTGLGTAYTLGTTAVGAIARVDTDKCVVVAADTTDTNKLKAWILSSSGFSSALTLDASSCLTTMALVAAVSTSTAIAVYRVGSTTYAVDFTVSGSAPTSAGTPVSTGGLNFTFGGAAAIDTTDILISYISGTTVTFRTIRASGGITWGTAATKTVTGGAPGHNSIAKLDTNKAIANIGDQDMVIVNTSGLSAPTFGTEYASGFGNASLGVFAIDTNTALIAGSISSVGRIESLDVDGSDNITSNGDIGTFNASAIGSAIPISTDLAAGEVMILSKVISDGHGHWITASGAPTPPAATSELRHLAFDADSSNLYVTANNNGTLQMFTYSLDTLTTSGTTSFGAATYAQIDSQTYGLHPVVEPGSDLVVYLRGRDGNDVQVQFNDLNGTAGWVDKGPGTATWGTAKFATGLHIDPLYTQILNVTFDDNDAYASEDRAATWIKMGDAPGNLRLSAAHPTLPGELYLGGTAAGTVLYTHNYGASYKDVSGTAMGTINAIEGSR